MSNVEHQEPPKPEQGPPQESHEIVQPMIDEMKSPPPASPVEQGPPRGPVHPPQPAELDQDAGGGYNRDHTIPQP